MMSPSCQEGTIERVTSARRATAKRFDERLSRTLDAALVVSGVFAVSVWLALVFVHFGDRYRIGHVQGHWMGLAQYASHGVLYPPLAEGGRFAGTRHMPLPIVVNAWASRLTGEYLMSGRAVAVVLFATLLVLVLATLRHMRCPWPLALALAGLLPATSTGLLVGSTPGGDLLSVVLQTATLLATSVALRRNGATGVLIASGILAGLAAASKLTGLWAMLAVASWLALRRNWRSLGVFLPTAWGTTAAVLGAFQWVSHGRLVETFRTLTFAGTGSATDWVRSPNQVMFFGVEHAIAIWAIVPLAILSVIAAKREFDVTIYHHALGWSFLLMLVVFADVGAGFNQLIDPGVLTVLSVGYVAARVGTRSDGTVTLTTVIGIAVVWAAGMGIRGFVPELREAITTLRLKEPLPQYTPRPLAAIVRPGDAILAEDPAIPVLLGQTPTILDPFMLRRLDDVRPDLVDGLIDRIRHGEFDLVALIYPLGEDESWWRQYHLGLRIVNALKSAYALADRVDGYYVYRRRSPRRTGGNDGA